MDGMTKLARLAGASLLALALPMAPQVAMAQQVASSITFDIPAQDLGKSLRAFSRATRQQIVFDDSAVHNKQAPAVQGAMSPQAALDMLLAGTNLVAQRGPSGILMVEARPSEGTQEEPNILVIAHRDEAETNLKVDEAASSDRSGAGLKALPQSTTVITSALLKLQQTQTVTDALRNVSGTTANYGNVQGVPSFTVRGFATSGLSNGLSSGIAQVQPVDNIERIEVLKGPSAILAGAYNLGGNVNLVTKRPSADPILSVTAQLGSYWDKKIAIDASNAITADKKLSARIIADVASAERNFGGYTGRREKFFAPSLRYKDQSLDIVAGGVVSESRMPATPYSYVKDPTIVDPAQAGFAVIEPNPRNPIGPVDQGISASSSKAYIMADAKVARWLTLVLRAEHGTSDLGVRMWEPYYTDNTGSYYVSDGTFNHTKSDAVDAYARFAFDTGPIKHLLTAGYNYSFSGTRQSQTAPDVAGPFPTQDGLTGVAMPPASGTPLTYSTLRQNAFYAQDLVQWGPAHVYAAWRRNRVTTVSQGLLFAYTQANAQSADSFSGGAVFDITRNLSIYGSYLSGYQPNSVVDRNGNYLKPQRGKNAEGGIKLDLFDKHLGIVASVYHLRQTNIPRYDLASASYFLLPGMDTSGFELDVNGQIAKGWVIATTFSTAKYQYIDPSKDDRTDYMIGQPRTRYSFFTAYTVQKGPLKDLGGSIGLYGFTSSIVGTVGSYRPGYTWNGVTVPEIYTRKPVYIGSQNQVDANLYYKIGKLDLNLGLRNLLDKKLYGVGISSSYIPLTAPRTFLLTGTYNFF